MKKRTRDVLRMSDKLVNSIKGSGIEVLETYNRFALLVLQNFQVDVPSESVDGIDTQDYQRFKLAAGTCILATIRNQADTGGQTRWLREIAAERGWIVQWRRPETTIPIDDLLLVAAASFKSVTGVDARMCDLRMMVTFANGETWAASQPSDMVLTHDEEMEIARMIVILGNIAPSEPIGLYVGTFVEETTRYLEEHWKADFGDKRAAWTKEFTDRLVGVGLN